MHVACWIVGVEGYNVTVCPEVKWLLVRGLRIEDQVAAVLYRSIDRNMQKLPALRTAPRLRHTALVFQRIVFSSVNPTQRFTVLQHSKLEMLK